MIYRSLKNYDNEQIKTILNNRNSDELILLPLSVGFYCNDYGKAQNICIKLIENENPLVRANAILGLAYIARNHKKLNKRIVKPYILKELRENKEYNWRIIDAVNDINLFLNWNLGSKFLQNN